MMEQRDSPGLPVRLLLAIWFALAVGVGTSGILERAPRPTIQVVLGLVTCATLVTLWCWPRLRRWSDTVSLRWLFVVHLGRFVGIYFLFLYGQGRLPWSFAVPGGWGDIVAAVGAAALILARSGWLERRPAVIAVWNTFGFLDILMVIAAAARNGLADPASMQELTRLPLVLLPLWLVPLIIVTHVLVFRRLWNSSGDRST